MATSVGALLVARRVSQSGVTKKIAARFRIQIVSDGAAADYLIPQLKIGFCVVELSPNLREQSFDDILGKLSAMRDKFQRRYWVNVISTLLSSPQRDALYDLSE